MPSKAPAKRTQALTEAGAPQLQAKTSPAKLRQMKRAAEAQIDDFMKRIGYTNPTERTDPQGWRRFDLGSAAGWAGVIEFDGELFLRVHAPIMRLPSDKDLILPLMRDLLELDDVILGSARLGIGNETVIVSIAQPVVDLGPDDFAFCIHRVMKLADDLDDMLISKYGGTAKKRVAPKKPVAPTAAAKSARKTPARNVRGTPASSAAKTPVSKKG
jgi:hypothetical protein